MRKKQKKVNDISDLKKRAAEKAVESVRSGMVIGLGTGSTAVFAIQAIARLIENGRLNNIVAVPTSKMSAEKAEELKIPLGTLTEHPEVDITIDGADEITPELNLIKGLGGALLHEKIVAQASRLLMIVADDSKRVQKLGTKAPVPVEVIPFAQRPVTLFLSRLASKVTLRCREDGAPFYTDEQNIILDCHFEAGIDNPVALAALIKQQPGVVEHGLFLGLASQAIIASPSNLTILNR